MLQSGSSRILTPTADRWKFNLGCGLREDNVPVFNVTILVVALIIIITKVIIRIIINIRSTNNNNV